jgi:hypothetical protein
VFAICYPLPAQADSLLPSAESPFEADEHFPDLDRVIRERSMFFRFQNSAVERPLEMVLKLSDRPDGHCDEVGEVLVGSATSSLRYAVTYRLCRTLHLISEAGLPAAHSWKDLIDAFHQALRLLIDEEFSKVGHAAA